MADFCLKNEFKSNYNDNLFEKKKKYFCKLILIKCYFFKKYQKKKNNTWWNMNNMFKIKNKINLDDNSYKKNIFY